METVPGEIARVSFSESEGNAFTDTVGGGTGALRGEAGFSELGRSGGGLGLPGSRGSFAELPHDRAFALGAGTLSFWAQPDRLGKLQGLIAKDASDFGGGGHLSVHLLADGRVGFRLQSADATFDVTSNRPIAIGEWSQVTVSWGADGMKLYLDGVLSGSGTYTGGLAGNAEPWVIGAFVGSSSAGSSRGSTNFFEGTIDEVSLFDRQLSDAEVQLVRDGLDGGSGQEPPAEEPPAEEPPAEEPPVEEPPVEEPPVEEPPAASTDAVARFSFAEGTGAQSTDAVGGWVAAFRGAAAFTADGRDGAALALPGSRGSFAEVAHDPDVTLDEGRISFWVRPDSVGKLQGMIAKDASGFGTGGHLSVHLTGDGRVGFRLQTDTTSHDVLSDRRLAVGEWAEITASWGDDGMRLFIDGQLAGSGAHTGGLAGNAEPWVIGAFAGNSSAQSSRGSTNFFDGTIDEIRIHDRQTPGAIETSGVLSFASDTGRGKIVDLARGLWVDAPRVMPLGDSNTLGQSNLLPSAEWASYRLALWQQLTDAGLFVDYVGGRANGPRALGDTDHQGTSGIRATQVAGNARNLAATHAPDAVLVMLGTNDALRETDAASFVPDALLSIITNLALGAPGVTVLLAPLPPIDPDAPGYPHLPNADDIRDAINAQLPGVVAAARAAGIDARFVPMPDLDDGDLYDGRHLTAEGHAEIAAAWFDALAEGLRIAGGDLLGERRAIAPDVRDLVGSERGDHLRGDANANRIDGGGGNDRIEGGLGADVLTGGPGNDVFVFRTRAEGGDTIVDFTPGADLLEFDDQAFGIAAGTRPLLRAAAEPTAQGTSAQFLYDTTDGRLLWDGDGTGAGARVLVATLAGSPAITAEDFLVI